MADKNAEVAVEDNGGMKKTLSLWNFFTIGFGAIIGTGWVLQVGDWMVVGGGPVPAMIAFLLGAIFLVPVGAVFGELTAAIPISGGIVAELHHRLAFGPGQRHPVPVGGHRHFDPSVRDVRQPARP